MKRLGQCEKQEYERRFSTDYLCNWLLIIVLFLYVVFGYVFMLFFARAFFVRDACLERDLRYRGSARVRVGPHLLNGTR